MSKSNIGWTDHSLNPYGWACNPVSPGCANCYAMNHAERLGKVFKRPPEWKGDTWFWRELGKIADGERVFVNSYSDTFHHKAQPAWIHTIFSGAVQRPGVIFLVLTKRIVNAHKVADELPWPDNLWLGTSVENGEYVERIDILRDTPAANRFISFEPLIGRIGRVDLEGVGWIITGGESGPNRRYFDKRWASEIVEQAKALDIPVMHKQGSAFAPGQDRILSGRTWDEYPAAWGLDQPDVVTAPEQLSLWEES